MMGGGDQSVAQSMQSAEWPRVRLAGRAHDSDGEHVTGGDGFNIGDLDAVLVAQRFELDEPAPNALVAAIRAENPVHSQRVKLHVRVKIPEHRILVAYVERIEPPRHGRFGHERAH